MSSTQLYGRKFIVRSSARTRAAREGRLHFVCGARVISTLASFRVARESSFLSSDG